jgi:hypothetical protein
MLVYSFVPLPNAMPPEAGFLNSFSRLQKSWRLGNVCAQLSWRLGAKLAARVSFKNSPQVVTLVLFYTLMFVYFCKVEKLFSGKC